MRSNQHARARLGDMQQRIDHGTWKILNMTLSNMAVEHRDVQTGRGRTRSRMWRMRKEAPPKESYVCECHARVFNSQRALSIHVEAVNQKPMTCPCHNRVFGTRGGYLAHMRPKQGKIACELCGRVLTKGTGMSQHIRAHRLAALGIKFPCPNCSEAFKSKIGLAMHLGNEALKEAEYPPLSVVERKEDHGRT